PRVYGMLNTAVFMRYFWRGIYDIVNGPLRNVFMDPILDMKQAALRANGVNVDPNFVNTIKSFVNGRRAYLAGELARVSPAFNVFGASETNTSANLLTVSGGAPINVAEVLLSLNGGPLTRYPLAWRGSGGFLA